MAAFILLTIMLQFCSTPSSGYMIEPKILNGIESQPAEFPFFANIVHSTFVCGATLISDRWLITAGHCLRKQVDFHIQIGIGSKGRFERRIRIDTAHQHIYPGHNETMKLYDLGLIELPEPIELGPSIQPARLPEYCDQVAAHELVIAAGNGRTYTASNRPNEPTLRHGVSKVMAYDECAAATTYRDDPQAIICGRSVDGRDVSSGDSGGPVVRAKDQMLIGIVSSAYVLDNDLLSVDFQLFTKIAAFYDWIAHSTGMQLPKCDCQAPIHQY